MDIGDDSDAGEDDLEDELNKLMFGGSKTNKPKKTKGKFVSCYNFWDLVFKKVKAPDELIHLNIIKPHELLDIVALWILKMFLLRRRCT